MLKLEESYHGFMCCKVEGSLSEKVYLPQSIVKSHCATQQSISLPTPSLQPSSWLNKSHGKGNATHQEVQTSGRLYVAQNKHCAKNNMGEADRFTYSGSPKTKSRKLESREPHSNPMVAFGSRVAPFMLRDFFSLVTFVKTLAK